MGGEINMKYHINKKGIPAVCHAEKGPCPLGGADNHFSTKEEAQKVSDERNADNYLTLNQNEFKLKKHASLYELFSSNNSILNHYNNLEKKKVKLENKFINTHCQKIKNKNKKEALVHAYKSTNREYQDASRRASNMYVNLQEELAQREQIVPKIKELKNSIDEVNFSRASASTYIKGKPNKAHEIIKSFEKAGYTVKVKPDFEDNGQSYGVRIADHEPAEYYRAHEHDINNVFKYTDVSILITYKGTETKKKLPRYVFNNRLKSLNNKSRELDKLFKKKE